MIQNIINNVLSQTYGDLIFIIGFGLVVVGSVVALSFFATRNQKSPHDED